MERVSPASASAHADGLQKLAKLFGRQARVAGDDPMVITFIGLWRGMARIRWPLLMMMCLPWRSTRKPAFSKARTAAR